MDAQAHKACSTTTSEKGSVVRGWNRHIQARNIEEPLSEELNQGYEGVPRLRGGVVPGGQAYPDGA